MNDSGTPVLLAIDTSTDQTGVALARGPDLYELSWSSGRRQTETLLEQIHRLLELATTTVTDLTGIAVAIGPGHFTALRVGVSTAKGFAIALDVPVVGIPSLDIVAYPVIDPLWTTVAVLSAGRDRLLWSVYAPGSHLTLQEPPRNTTAVEFEFAVRAIAGQVRVAGNPGLDFAAMDGRIRLGAGGFAHARPAAMIAIARDRFTNNQTDDLVRLEPVYLSR